MTAAPARLDPYRPLFLIGLGHALAGTLVWLLAALDLVAYPGVLHRILMIEGFEQSFVSGFLLTALGGLTHGGRSSTLDMALTATAQVGVGVAALAGQAALAHGCFLISLMVLVVAAGGRSLGGRSHGRPPRELIFIVTALLMGLGGAILLLVGTLRPDGALLALGFRLVAQGEVLTLVVGVGSMLVPMMLGHRAPNLVTQVARPGWRSRSVFYAAIVAALAGSLALEAFGSARVAAATRAAAVSAVLLGVWRVQRDGPAIRLAFVVRSAGFAIASGLWLAVLVPGRPLLGEHVLFIGGYGLLTMGIATRVIVAHGGWPPQDETRLLHAFSLIALAASLGLRVASELLPAHASILWGAAGASWSVAWLSWAIGAVPRVVALNRARVATA